MQIKDIVNRDVVNLTNCEHEPIHIPGSIQPHGFLWAVTRDSFSIDFCSSNCADFTEYNHTDLLGKPLEEILGSDQMLGLKDYVTSLHAAAAPHTLMVSGRKFSCSVHQSADRLILEFEPIAQEEIAVSDVYQQTKQFAAYMQAAETLKSLCQAVANETRAITNYDRVMIYKFDEAYNGEVFAEACRPDLEPFLGLHYPHTDIPVQARQLYIKNLLRLIPDVNYTPVPIYTIDDASGKNLDLSYSTLRSVSPIHVQYLHNMGVGATLTISLLHEGKLWGLIACHHYSPKYISMHLRIAAQLQGHFLTSQISVRQQAEEYLVSRNVNKALDDVTHMVFDSENLSIQQLVEQPALLQLTHANGVCILIDEELFTAGIVPKSGDLKKLANHMSVFSPPAGYSTNRLVDVYEDGYRCTEASGVIFHSLGANANNYIMWFRPEALQEVNWAGDPQKAIIKDEKGLSPRKSFELWKEVKKCESLPWQKPELSAAAIFASALQKQVYTIFLSKEEKKQRLLSEKLQEANNELENINWIGSHDLKEPLRKIQMFASRILLDDDTTAPLSIVNSVKKMSESAGRMQSLIKDILSYSRLSHIQEAFVKVSLNDILKSVLEELSFEIEESNAQIKADQLPEVNGISFLLQQLFANLLRNSIKFSHQGQQPVITIRAEYKVTNPASLNKKLLYNKVTFSDNGIGFDNNNKENIFKVFTRLHNKEKYQGTGIGLSLCRKIMINHNGHITAEGRIGEGADFDLYFPVV